MLTGPPIAEPPTVGAGGIDLNVENALGKFQFETIQKQNSGQIGRSRKRGFGAPAELGKIKPSRTRQWHALAVEDSRQAPQSHRAPHQANVMRCAHGSFLPAASAVRLYVHFRSLAGHPSLPLSGNTARLWITKMNPVGHIQELYTELGQSRLPGGPGHFLAGAAGPQCR